MNPQTLKTLRFWFCFYVYYIFKFSIQSKFETHEEPLLHQPAPSLLVASGDQSQACRGGKCPF